MYLSRRYSLGLGLGIVIIAVGIAIWLRPHSETATMPAETLAPSSASQIAAESHSSEPAWVEEAAPVKPATTTKEAATLGDKPVEPALSATSDVSEESPTELEERVRGVVVDEHGKPLEGVTINLRYGKNVKTARSDREGFFAMVPHHMPIVLTAEKAGYNKTRRTLKTIPKVPLELVLQSLIHFTIQVVDENDIPVTSYRYRAVPGLSQRFEKDSPDYFKVWQDHEDGEGKVILPNLKRGHKIDLMIQAEGFRTRVFRDLLVSGSDQTSVLVMKTAENPILGTVIDVNGQPIEGVEVLLSGHFKNSMNSSFFRWSNFFGEGYRERPIHESQISDENGVFSFSRPDEAFGFDLLFTASGYAFRRLPDLHHESADTLGRFAVTLQPAGSIAGEVNRSKVEGRLLIDMQHHEKPSIYLTHFMDSDDATFSFNALPEGAYTVKLKALDQSDLKIRKETTLVPGQTVKVRMGFESKARLAGLALRGGAPFQDGLVVVYPEPRGYSEAVTTRTDDAGRFVVEELLTGRYTVTALYDPDQKISTPDMGYLMRDVHGHTVELPPEGLSDAFAFPRLSTVTGHLKDAGPHQLMLIGEQAGVMNQIGADSDEQGHFKLHNIHPGRYKLMMKSGLGLAHLVDVTVPANGADIDLGEIDEGDKGSLRLLVDAPEQTLKQLMLMIQDENGALASVKMLDPGQSRNRDIMVDDLSVGNMSVAVTSGMSGWESPLYPVTILAEGITELAVTLHPTTILLITGSEEGAGISTILLTHEQTGEELTIDSSNMIGTNLTRVLGKGVGMLSKHMALAKGINEGRWQVVLTYDTGKERRFPAIVTKGEMTQIGI